MSQLGEESRMAIASQTCQSKGWGDENGRESCWRNLGGRSVEWVDPVDEEKWFDKDKDNRRVKNIEVIDIRGIFIFFL